MSTLVLIVDGEKQKHQSPNELSSMQVLVLRPIYSSKPTRYSHATLGNENLFKISLGHDINTNRHSKHRDSRILYPTHISQGRWRA